jgi:hypothetical protein
MLLVPKRRSSQQNGRSRPSKDVWLTWHETGSCGPVPTCRPLLPRYERPGPRFVPWNMQCDSQQMHKVKRFYDPDGILYRHNAWLQHSLQDFLQPARRTLCTLPYEATSNSGTSTISLTRSWNSRRHIWCQLSHIGRNLLLVSMISSSRWQWEKLRPETRNYWQIRRWGFRCWKRRERIFHRTP